MIFFQLLHKMHFLFTIGKKYETTEFTEGFSVFSKRKQGRFLNSRRQDSFIFLCSGVSKVGLLQFKYGDVFKLYRSKN